MVSQELFVTVVLHESIKHEKRISTETRFFIRLETKAYSATSFAFALKFTKSSSIKFFT